MIGSIAALGVGVLGLGGMGVFGGLALAEHDALAAGCGASMTCAAGDVQTSDTFALVADINLGVGAAGIVTGVILLALAVSSGGGGAESALRLRRDAGEGVVRW